MNIDEVFKKIPVFVASFYDSIYAFNESKNLFYSIEYNGEELKVGKQQTYVDLVEKLSIFKEDLLSTINNDEPMKKVVSTKDNREMVVTVDNEADFTFIFIMDISKKVSEEKKYLLIADDSPIITKFFTKIFSNDFEVLVAADGKEAINILNQYSDKPIVGVFMDLSMPNMNGYDLLEYFKQNNLFVKYPVSIISGEDTADGISKAFAYSGVIDMLKKPFSIDAAKAIVNKTISFSPNIK